MNFFEVRDRFDHYLLGAADAPQTAVSVMWILLAHTWYVTDKKGWVHRNACGIRTLSRLTRLSESSIKRSLKELEEAGMITRRRHDRDFRRYPDDIWVTILERWYPGVLVPPE